MNYNSYELSQDQLEFYDKNGFLKIEGMWEKEEIEVIRNDMDEFANGHFTNKLDSHYYANIQKAHTGKKMCDVGDAILRARAVPIGSIAFYCKPNNTLELGSTWHQDNYAGKSPDGNNYLNWIENNLIDSVIIKPSIFGGYKKSLELYNLCKAQKPTFGIFFCRKNFRRYSWFLNVDYEISYQLLRE